VDGDAGSDFFPGRALAIRATVSPARTPALRCVETLVGVALFQVVATREAAMDPHAIRLLIRAKLGDGRLPRDSAPKALGRPGNGEKCDACEEILRTAALMLEVYPLTKDTKIVRFHGDCYAIWNGERHALTS
jgi:hypothetical protein